MTDKLTVGKTIRMPCMRRGLCAYPDATILLGPKVLEEMAKTAYGIPLTIGHPSIPINDNTLKSIPLAGRVSSMDYNAATDEWFAEFVCDSAEGVELLQKGYGVSTGWYGDKYGPGGTYNGVPYDKELQKARYGHLAIVKDPRYEMARDPIFLNSKSDTCIKDVNADTIVNKQSKSMETKQMFKLFRNRREDIKMNEGEDVLVDMDGDEKPLSQLVSEYLEIKKAAVKKNTKILAGDEMVDVDGEKMSVKDLIAAVKGSRKDAEAEPVGFKEEDKVNAAAPAPEAEEEKKENAKPEGEEPKEHEKAKTNSRFEDLKSVHENSAAVEEPVYLSSKERVDMGKARYGSPKK